MDSLIHCKQSIPFKFLQRANNLSLEESLFVTIDGLHDLLAIIEGHRE